MTQDAPAPATRAAALGGRHPAAERSRTRQAAACSAFAVPHTSMRSECSRQRILAGAMPDAPPCLSCGACCFSTLETYVRVTGEDHARLGEHASSLTHFVGHRCYMKMRDGRCAALNVTDLGTYTCTVYALRPSVCRDLERGSPACEAELARKEATARRAKRLPQAR